MTVLWANKSKFFVRFSNAFHNTLVLIASCTLLQGMSHCLGFPCCLLNSLGKHFLNCRAQSSCVGLMAPFLRYLYCEPSQLREYAELRMGLLKILLQPHGPKHKEAPSVLECQILQLLCDLIPHLQVRLLPDITFYK